MSNINYIKHDVQSLDSSSEVGAIIINEQTANKVEFKIKGEDKLGYVKAEGILQEGNEINRNKRYYPMEELARNVASQRVRELVESGNFKGEAGHPTDTSLARQSKVDPTLEQVWYTKLWTEGNFVKGQFMGSSNQYGKSFNEDLKRGQKPSFSLRAVGSLINENGRMTVNKMQMIAYDRVYFPSHSKAYTSHIVTTESVGFNQPMNVKQYEINEDDYFYYKTPEINSLSEAGNIVDCDEPIIVPITKESLNNFIITESDNVNLVLNNFDILYESMNIDNTFNIASVKTKSGNTINIYLEDAIKREILYGINSMF